jgi:hypothetical protein
MNFGLNLLNLLAGMRLSARLSRGVNQGVQYIDARCVNIFLSA